MPIDLIDIPAAVADYLDNQVRTVVSPVIGQQSSQAALTPGQDGTFTVTVTNRGMPDGVRLINVAYHVKISDEAIAQLIVPEAAMATCYDTLAATTALEPGSRRSALFLRLHAGSTLDVGESQPVQIEVHCQDPGDAKITCHVHADIDASDLFPTSQNRSGEQTVSVIRGAF
jgi:hypothetical protein